MELTVEKWGDDLAVRLPAAVTEDLGLTEGCKVSVAKTEQGWILKRITPLPKFSLSELTEGITQENLQKVNDDRPAGKEIW